MTVSAVKLTGNIRSNRLRIFRTSDVEVLGGLTPAAASQSLGRLERGGLLIRLKRGVWASQMGETVDPCEAVPQLTAPWPSYVSLYTALSRAGVTEEVPSVIYGITAGRPLRLKNSLGEFRFHHLPGPLFWGYAPAGAYRNYALAEPEKAFLDLVYLGLHPRSPLGLPFSRHGRWPLDMQKLHRYAQKFRSRKLNGYIRSL